MTSQKTEDPDKAASRALSTARALNETLKETLDDLGKEIEDRWFTRDEIVKAAKERAAAYAEVSDTHEMRIWPRKEKLEKMKRARNELDSVPMGCDTGPAGKSFMDARRDAIRAVNALNKAGREARHWAAFLDHLLDRPPICRAGIKTSKAPSPTSSKPISTVPTGEGTPPPIRRGTPLPPPHGGSIPGGVRRRPHPI